MGVIYIIVAVIKYCFLDDTIAILIHRCLVIWNNRERFSSSIDNGDSGFCFMYDINKNVAALDEDSFSVIVRKLKTRYLITNAYIDTKIHCEV